MSSDGSSNGVSPVFGAGIFALTGQMAELAGSWFPLAGVGLVFVADPFLPRIHGEATGDPNDHMEEI